VTFWFCMALSTSNGSGLGSMTMVPAIYMGAFMAVVMPYMWNSGRAVRNTSLVSMFGAFLPWSQ